jgi:hypothetical protein
MATGAIRLRGDWIRVRKALAGACFHIDFHFFYVYLFFVCSVSDVYFLTSGASSPEWVEPTAEGGGFVCFDFLCFSVCMRSTL